MNSTARKITKGYDGYMWWGKVLAPQYAEPVPPVCQRVPKYPANAYKKGNKRQGDEKKAVTWNKNEKNGDIVERAATAGGGLVRGGLAKNMIKASETVEIMPEHSP